MEEREGMRKRGRNKGKKEKGINLSNLPSIPPPTTMGGRASY